MTADTPPPVTAPVACVDRPESRAYVAAVKERAFERWQVTADDPHQRAVIAFRLDEQGRVVSSEVRTSSNELAARRASEALAAAAPYPPMPPEANCLARMKLIARFETPEAKSAETKRRPEPEGPWGWVRLAVVIGSFLFALVPFLRRRGAPRGEDADSPAPAQAPDAAPTPELPGTRPLGERSQLRPILILGATLVAAALFYWLAS